MQIMLIIHVLTLYQKSEKLKAETFKFFEHLFFIGKCSFLFVLFVSHLCQIFASLSVKFFLFCTLQRYC